MSDQQADEALFAQLSETLVTEATRAIGPWVVQAVAVRSGNDVSLQTAAQQAGDRATDELGAALRELLARDIDQQPTNPLAVLRQAVPFATAVLADAGTPSVARDADAIELHPEDHYDLTPGAFIDFGEAVHEAGIRWGAGKAHLHLSRRKEAKR